MSRAKGFHLESSAILCWSITWLLIFLALKFKGRLVLGHTGRLADSGCCNSLAAWAGKLDVNETVRFVCPCHEGETKRMNSASTFGFTNIVWPLFLLPLQWTCIICINWSLLIFKHSWQEKQWSSIRNTWHVEKIHLHLLASYVRLLKCNLKFLTLCQVVGMWYCVM